MSRAGLLVRGALAGVALTRIARAARPVRPLSAGAADPAADGPLHREPTAADGPVSVVIPARDEVARIGPCLTALRHTTGIHEVIVVDDESTDGTAELARSLGARVVPGRPLPRGWVGKVWALEQGLQAATGTWVVTLDADAVPDPALVAVLVARAARDGVDLASAGGRFVCTTPGQRWLHPAMLTTLVYRFGPPPGDRQVSPARAVVNGQCLAFRRATLLAAGGFGAVRSHLTDDIALARHLRSRGLRIGFYDGSGLLDVAMHTSFAETWHNWGRSLPMPDVTAPAAQMLDLAVVCVALALPIPRLLTGRGDALDIALTAVRFGALLGTARSYARRGVWYWLSPLADLPVAVRLTQAAVRPERTWRGRHYPAPAPEGPAPA